MLCHVTVAMVFDEIAETRCPMCECGPILNEGRSIYFAFSIADTIIANGTMLNRVSKICWRLKFPKSQENQKKYDHAPESVTSAVLIIIIL